MNPTLGISFKLLNLLLFTGISILFHYLSGSLHVIQVSFIIGIFAILAMLPWIIATKAKHIKVGNWKKYIYRSFFNMMGFFTWLYALQEIGANDATAVSYMIPIFTTILAVVFCGERLNVKCMSAITLSFVGAYIILQPDGSNALKFGAIVALISSLMWACHDITCKLQTVDEHPLTQAFIIFAITAVMKIPFAYYVWQPVPTEDLVFIGAMGVLAAANVTVLFLAYRFAPITLLMPFSYLRILFMAVATYFLFGDMLKQNSFAGVLIIIISSSYIYYQQRQGKLAV